MTVSLYTRDGGFVADAEIPPFNEAPDVIIWGERFFVVPDVDVNPELLVLPADQIAYVEAFTYAVPFSGARH